jgi:Tfp pilus assembly protein PilN
LQRDLEKSHQKIDYIKNNLAKKDLDKNNSKIDSKELSRLRTKIEFFNQLMNSMNFSYLGMLNYLEDNLPLGVRLKRLDLNIDKRSLSIAGETKSHEKMILFLENLEASPNFERNFLSSQSKQKKGGKEKLNSLISFNLTSFIKEVN